MSGLHQHSLGPEPSGAPGERARLEGREVLPGMPIEAFLQTGARSVLSYLACPLTDHLRHAFREG